MTFIPTKITVKINKVIIEIARNVGINPATLRKWEKQVNEIMKWHKGSRRLSGGGRHAFWPEMERELVKEFTIARDNGVSINRGWFLRHAKSSFRNLYPEEVIIILGCSRFIYPLKFSATWFSGFRSWFRISWRMKTNVAQLSTTNKVHSIQQYLQFIRCNSRPRGSEVLQDIGRYRLGHIYNMNQTPLPFEFLWGRTYEVKGKKTVWVRSLRSSWIKRQATLMITACADGVLRIKPLIIFRGEDSSHWYDKERACYDPRVWVIFNNKAESNEQVTLDWIYQDLLPAITSNGSYSDPQLLALDVFTRQKTATVVQTFRSNKSITVFIPEGCTSLVQPMDTSINKILKEQIGYLLDIEVEQNPTL